MNTNWSRIIVVALVILPMAYAAAETSGDAGTGLDAGNLIEDALVLDGPGTYTGILLSGDDIDWFRLDTSAPVCGIAHATANGNSDLVLTRGVGHEDMRNVADDNGAPNVLAAWFDDRVYLGLDPFSLLDTASEYTFSIETRTLADLGPGDGGTGGDAAGGFGSATPLTTPCVTGGFTKSSDRDVYSFNGTNGSLALLSADGRDNTTAIVDLVAPSGAIVTTITSPDALEVMLNETGTWYVVAAPDVELTASTSYGSDLQNYLLGLGLDDEPKTRPCRPNCLE